MELQKWDGNYTHIKTNIHTVLQKKIAVFRILRPVDGAPVFLSDSEFRYNQEMWDQLRKIMDIVGFSQEVKLLYSVYSTIIDRNLNPKSEALTLKWYL